ncbi:MAG: hypothetical protein ACI379_05890 [Nocardioides sp.]|uniref:hypothetical protein n=1 Tax=Nocardioides sp. TaxID=35761 RepID=UPI003EFCE198
MARRSKKSLLETAQDVVDQASESAQGLAGHLAESVGPTIETIVETAKEKADEALTKADEVLHADEAPKKKGGKLKKFLLVSILAAVGGVIFSKARAKKAQDANWQASYTPTPAPTTTPKPAPVAAEPAAPAAAAASDAPAEPEASDDEGGAGPAESISDAVEEPHEATDPDAPAEVIDVDDVPKS